MKVQPQSEHSAAETMVFKKSKTDFMITVYGVIVDFLAFTGFDYLFKVSSKITRTMCVMSSKVAKKKPGRRY